MVMNIKDKSEDVARVSLGAFLSFAGISHLTFAREDFQAQVPDWIPLDKDLTVILSGFAEISLGMLLILFGKKKEIYRSVGRTVLYRRIPG